MTWPATCARAGGTLAWATHMRCALCLPGARRVRVFHCGTASDDMQARSACCSFVCAVEVSEQRHGAAPRAQAGAGSWCAAACAWRCLVGPTRARAACSTRSRAARRPSWRRSRAPRATCWRCRWSWPGSRRATASVLGLGIGFGHARRAQGAPQAQPPGCETGRVCAPCAARWRRCWT